MPNPIITRELVYTGIPRARDWLTLIEAKRGILNDAVTREVMRVSGMEGVVKTKSAYYFFSPYAYPETLIRRAS